MKQLLHGEIRFLARQFDKKTWGVYDKARACWPHQTPELGVVRQQLESEADAQAEAERLNQKQVASPSGAKSSTPKKQGKKNDPVAPELLPEEQEIEDYGLLSEEERKKYEDGLMEKVVY